MENIPKIELIPAPLNYEQIIEVDKKMRAVFDRAVDAYRERLEELIKTVLRGVLMREPTLEDAKLCCLAQRHDLPNESHLLYNGVPLGIIRTTHGLNGVGASSISFEPFKNEINPV